MSKPGMTYALTLGCCGRSPRTPPGALLLDERVELEVSEALAGARPSVKVVEGKISEVLAGATRTVAEAMEVEVPQSLTCARRAVVEAVKGKVAQALT